MKIEISHKLNICKKYNNILLIKNAFYIKLTYLFKTTKILLKEIITKNIIN